MYPTTALGKLVATFAMVSGLLVLALPISIIGTNFLVCYEKLDERNRRVKILEELEEKLKVEEKEARLEAETSLLRKQRDTLEKMPWRKKKKGIGGGIKMRDKLKLSSISSPKAKDIVAGFGKSFRSGKPKNIKAAAVAAHWSVSGSSFKGDDAVVRGSDESPVGEGDDPFPTTPPSPTEAIDNSPFSTRDNANRALVVKGVQLKGKSLAAHKLQKHRLAQKKSMETDGHQSLVGLKAKARLTPSFLLDTNIVLNPPANLTFINVERKQSLLSLSLAGFGKAARRKSNHVSDVALAVKYKPLLDKAQNVLECIQVSMSRVVYRVYCAFLTFHHISLS